MTMERRLSISTDAILERTARPIDETAPSSYLTVPHATGPRSVRSEGRGSNRDFDPSINRSATLIPAAPPRTWTLDSWRREEMVNEHRGELSMADKYTYLLSKAQLKASSNTSALLAGFAMVCLVELQYDENTPGPLLIILGVVTALLVSVHLLALMMSTCILPYMEASGATHDSPHIKLKFYIDLSWFFSTCVGLLLFLVEIGLIFYIKFRAIDFPEAGYVTTAILVPVLFVFIIISCFIHRSRANYSIERMDKKVSGLKQLLGSSHENVALMKVV